ncbi:hypothetical protein [Amycolatopsis australiensis]|uniref:Uncharacterized protein n=1 Tax=Amycolatopsis australiensis TaxID=546364 RepID=A0A1K1T6H5_9PSEU|nr:hypothetical protein [Amycolatopsis australiensis]SFW92118.1 hypothetical protein SAMN04489730_8395 [Amycolatopsis australiensis]
MPKPIEPQPGDGHRPLVPVDSRPARVLKDEEVALELPEWDLLPPAEFIERHRGR